MRSSSFGRVVPESAIDLKRLLDPAREPLERPIRAEIFGPERFEQHGRSLGESHAVARRPRFASAFFPRLEDNIAVLREAHHYIGGLSTAGHDISPAGEWLLDNFHLVEAQLAEIRTGLPRSFFRHLPVLAGEPLIGLPRIYGVAWAFVAHTDSAFNQELLHRFLRAYQQSREITFGELWALPTTLRVVLIENLRRLAERAAVDKASREVANFCCDRMGEGDPTTLEPVLAELNRRGAGESFLAQVAQHLQDAGQVNEPRQAEWLRQQAPHLAEIQTRQADAQAADNLSVGNAIQALRAIGDADWPALVADSSVLVQRMMASPLFAAERDDTRDHTLHAIERLARKSGRSEREVADRVIDHVGAVPGSAADAASDAPERSPRHWLLGEGRATLAGELGLDAEGAARWRRIGGRLVLPLYLGALAAASLAAVVWLVWRHASSLPAGAAVPWVTLLAALLLLFPVSEAVVAVINRLIGESRRPSRLPRLAFAAGIPPEHRVLLVVPVMLTQPASGEALAHRLLLHHLANPEAHAQFALLSDWPDAPAAEMPADAASLGAARAAIRRLNEAHPMPAGQPPRFLLLHRPRSWSASEQAWIGRERKRGKLEALLEALVANATASHGAAATPFLDLGEESLLAAGVPYVVTLDSDTDLPPGRLRELVAVAGHPDNRPRLAADGRRVERGYAILQPHVATPLPTPESVTRYHWLFAGQPGLDPYSIASSEVYQDVFGEGTFTGKGLLHVEAVHAVLGGRLPGEAILSHDLLEGSIARCAAVTDIPVVEDAPFHADVAASRVHRWTRGDWQLLPLLLDRRFRFGGVNRWKMIDNLRRSLVAPASLSLVALALATSVVSPWVALAIVALAFTAGPLLGLVAAAVPGGDDVAKPHYYRQAAADLVRSLCAGAWLIAQLLEMAAASADAIGRALWRMLVSRRRLLQWTTAAAAQAAASVALPTLAVRHRRTTVAAGVLVAGLFILYTPWPGLTLALGALWGLSPVWTWWVSRPPAVGGGDALSAPDRAYLHGVARDTWRLFERCVTAEENHLPPDNLQVVPDDMVAHRTSPTNIGLYLLATCCAQRFGWIGGTEAIDRIEATLDTLDRLPRHRGHFLNWYDTARAEALMPLYVSTVDSGNLCVHLLAVAAAARELAVDPHGEAALTATVADTARAVAEHAASHGTTAHGAAVAALLAESQPLAALRADPELFAVRLEAAEREHAEAPRPERQSDQRATPAERLAWAIDDQLATLRSALRDRRAVVAAGSADAAAGRAAARLEAIARRCEAFAEQADFSFLHHRQRRLFHIGYRVAEAQLDAGFYDLLASEARATSLWAIAKGDVQPGHWAALGRPFFAVGDLAGLRSWSGSMFEYLMPSLVLDEPEGSVLHNAVRAAVQEHMAFGREHSVPWGVSECAYAASDHTLAYQYAPQGVPRLALRRTPADELVIAPYATTLAAQALPHRAANNLRRLERMAGRGRYGFVEALDFTRARQSANEGVTRVQTFMAHHQGMGIVALANVLLERAPRRWGMRDARIQAVSSLLHERAPREVPNLHEPVAPTTASARARRLPGVLRELAPGSGALPPTHLISNGRYAVALRPNGAGTSRWRKLSVHRERDDALRDDTGWFCYLRWDRSPEPTSLTQHPAPDRGAEYASTFHLDRAVFGAAWSEVEATTVVWVSPEDDLEFRRVVLVNRSSRELDLELISAFEPTLADPRADESHPAFQNLFLQAEWRAGHQALVFHRQPRLATDAGVHLAHFIAAADPPAGDVRVQVDRAAWRGRNHPPERPLAAMAEVPRQPESVRQDEGGGDGNGSPGQGGRGIPLDTGLDPAAVISVRLRIPAGLQARITFATAIAGDAATLDAVIDRHRQPHHVERASTMSSTLAAIRLRETRLNAETFLAVQSLTTLLVQTPSRLQAATREAGDIVDRRRLWRFGISGDRPIVLVSAGVMEGAALLRAMAQALRIWSWGGVAVDLVVTNHEPASYVMALSRVVAELAEAHAAARRADPGAAETSMHLLQSTDLHPDELSTLRALARVRLNADGRPLVHHVEELEELHERALVERQAVSVSALPHAMLTEVSARRPQGDFAETSGEFRFDVSALQRPLRPWVNVMANPAFGAQLSEAGGGHSWGGNSRLNMLTPWSNDPVADPAGEWFLLQDTKSRAVWSVTPSAAGDPEADYRIAHGQGSSTVSHRRGSLDVAVTWCVDPVLAVKQVRVRLVNRGHRTASVRAIGVAEWIVGAQRSDRGTTSTRVASGVAGEPARRRTTLFCTQRDRSAGFGGGTALLSLVADVPEGDNDLDDWTTDRRELFDARGRPVVPDQLGRATGLGLDPCAALATRLVVRAGETRDAVFLLGYAASPEAAESLAVEAARVPPLVRLQAVRAHWDTLLDAQVVKTPDPLFDRFVNRWLLYQTLSCRLDARAGFYQAGGAYGYRDQLQDTLGLAWTAPHRLRQQILLGASRQFPEGDVQHWWHAPTGAGVRTHFSDDLLWLPYATAHYVEATGDAGVLDEAMPYLEGAPIPPGAEDAYYVPATSDRESSLYEHAARTIDRSLTHGAHDLPLMGTGDWNDGMNRVGHEGRGESVWLGWFLLTVIDRFGPIAAARGDAARVATWHAARARWQHALNDAGWDGAWFRRAFFDDGSPLGSAANAECRIDLIAQAWSVLSGGTTAERQRQAMAAVETHLLDDEAGVVRLLDPPLAQAMPSAGYIQAYPPGVRENGGQYSHAGVWAVLAFAELGDAEAAWRAFRYLSPPHRSRDRKQGPAYGIEPYVMPGDVYTAPPYVGRGGWSWYTGSAAWMHRAAIEGLFGCRRRGDLVSFEPCLPPGWPSAELALTRDGRTVRVVFTRDAAAVPAGARPLARGEAFRWSETPSGTVFHASAAAGGPVASYEAARAVPIRPAAGVS